MFQSIVRKKMYEEVVDQILGAISSGEFPVGSKLPSERELADSFQVSRTVIREAIRSMESVGYLESRANGTYIKEPSIDNLIVPILSVLGQDGKIANDLLELRLILEPSAAALAAKRITTDQLHMLDSILTAMESCVALGQTGSQYDAEFHKNLIAMSQNEVLKSVYTMCESTLRDMIDSVGNIENQPTKACIGHREIFRALQSNNPLAAKQAMYNHLKQIVTRLGRKIDVPI